MLASYMWSRTHRADDGDVSAEREDEYMPEEHRGEKRVLPPLPAEFEHRFEQSARAYRGVLGTVLDAPMVFPSLLPDVLRPFDG